MSNRLRRKKKKMEPLGYAAQEINAIYRHVSQKAVMDNITAKAYLDIKLISYFILHDKFGWGLKRIKRLESSINQCLEKGADRNIGGLHYANYLLERCHIDVNEEVNKIPYRDRMFLVYDKLPRNAAVANITGQVVLAAIFNYIAMSGTVLREEFRFSVRQLREYIEWIRYWMGSITLWKENDGKRGECVECIAQILLEECKYCDSRYVKVEDV